MKHLALMLAPAAAFAIPAMPAYAAQEDAGDKVNQLIVYGDDPCPQSSEEEIVVCARKEEAERYRIPENLRGSDSPDNEAWSERVMAYEYVGKTGTESCSPVGPGGFTGCLDRIIETAYAERENRDSVNWGRLIEAERQKRLDRIDEEAEEVERRLREIEEQEAAEAEAAAETEETVTVEEEVVETEETEGGE